MIKYEKIIIGLNFKTEVMSDRLKYVQDLRLAIDKYVKKALIETNNIKEDEVIVDMVTIEKSISEILYEDERYRVVSTKSCNSLVQIKKDEISSSGIGFIWIDHAWYSSGPPEESFKKAINEIERLKTKKNYRRFIKKEIIGEPKNKIKRITRQRRDRLNDAQIDALKLLVESNDTITEVLPDSDKNVP